MSDNISEYYGPGVWYMLQVKALKVVDIMSFKEFDKSFKDVRETFPCAKCRTHMAQYVEEHSYMNNIYKNKYGIFEWMVNFHNSVNKRLGKKEMSFNDALSGYLTMVNSNIVENKNRSITKELNTNSTVKGSKGCASCKERRKKEILSKVQNKNTQYMVEQEDIKIFSRN